MGGGGWKTQPYDASVCAPEFSIGVAKNRPLGRGTCGGGELLAGAVEAASLAVLSDVTAGADPLAALVAAVAGGPTAAGATLVGVGVAVAGVGGIDGGEGEGRGVHCCLPRESFPDDSTIQDFAPIVKKES